MVYGARACVMCVHARASGFGSSNKTEFYQRWMSPYCKSRTPFLLHVMCFVLRVLCKCPTDMSERLHVCCRAEVGGFPPFLESPMRFPILGKRKHAKDADGYEPSLGDVP